MIIHDFDTDTGPVVKPECIYGRQQKLVHKCLVLFSGVILRCLLDRYDCSVIGTAGAGSRIYCFSHEGEKIAFYLSGVGSALASATCYEVYWKTGATRFILFGSCGSLDREKTGGKYIIPSECYRGDGCSYYYAPPSDYLPVKKADALAAVFDEIGIPYIKGRVWTTDSMLRETAGLVRRRWKGNWPAWKPYVIFTAWNCILSWKPAIFWMKTAMTPVNCPGPTTIRRNSSLP